jgi:nucleoside-diphosphate-sugar epimerase
VPELASKRVLIAGGAGFIGANLAAELRRRGADVHVAVRSTTNLWRLAAIRPPIECHHVDLTDTIGLAALIRKIQPQIIFNAAASGGHPSNARERAQALQDNVLSTCSLLEALAETGFERLVHFGSSLEYGWKREPIVEASLLDPVTFRGATKAAATLLCRQFARSEGRSVVIIRPFSVFGPWETGTRLVPTLMLSLLQGRAMRLTAPGIRRDFVFIDDVTEAALLAAQATDVDGQVFNVGSGTQWTNEELVDAAQQTTGIKISVTTDAFPLRPSDTDCWVADIGKSRRLLGWAPRHTLREGLDKTFTWFREHESQYDRVEMK